jgi:hypothetical protein
MKGLTLFMVMLIAFASCNTETLFSEQNPVDATPQDGLDFITSFLAAGFGEPGKAASSCISNGQEIFNLFEASIDDFRSERRVDILSGFVKIATALQKIQKQLKDCEKAGDLDKIITTIVYRIINPITLSADVARAFLWNSSLITGNLLKLAIDFDRGDFSGSGKNLGGIIYLIWGHAYPKSTPKMTGPTQASIDTVEGILVGAFGDDGKEVVVCVNDGEAIFVDIEAAITEFKKGGVTNIVSGLYHIGEALEELPAELKDCEQAEAILADIEKIVAEFKAPKELVIHVGEEVLWHGKDIYKDITGATTDFKDGQYEPAGEAIGDIIKLLLVESVTKMIKTSA